MGRETCVISTRFNEEVIDLRFFVEGSKGRVLTWGCANFRREHLDQVIATLVRLRAESGSEPRDENRSELANLIELWERARDLNLAWKNASLVAQRQFITETFWRSTI